MTTTGHEIETLSAREAGIGGGMARVFFVVEWLFADGSFGVSQTFATKRAATRFAKGFRSSNLKRARVMAGGQGGLEVAKF